MAKQPRENPFPVSDIDAHGSHDVLGKPGLPRRLAAMFYDALLSLGLSWGIAAIYLALFLTRHDVAVGERALQGSQLAGLRIVVVLGLLVFFGWCWSRSGQTLGMQAWRLRIDSDQGGRISWRQACIRFFGAAVSAACLGLGYFWILFDEQKRSWHDRWSSSHIVLLPPKKKKEKKA